MHPHTDTQKRPLKRYFEVRLNGKEAANLKKYTTEKAGNDYLRGTPRLIKKRNGKYVAKIFRRFGIIYGSTTAIGNIKFVSECDLKIVVRSGGLRIGYFTLTICLFFILMEVVFLLRPDIVEVLELENPSASVVGIAVFAFMSWLFLSRYMREPDLEKMEGYLKGKIGGRWREV